MEISVVVPTYQERDTIKPLVERIAKTLTGEDYEIIVVDDNSPDGTAEVAANLTRDYPVRVLKRKGKLGLGTAIAVGFESSDAEIIGVIDADLQHPPELLPQLLRVIEEGNDIAVASRYVKGGGTETRALFRKLVSKCATLLARPLTKVKDPTSGYFFVNKQVIKGKRFPTIGYKLLMEILVLAKYGKVKEVPYVLGERQAGRSKLGPKEYAAYLELLYRLYMHKAKDYLVPRVRGPRTYREETYASNLAGSPRHELSPRAIYDTQVNKLSISIGICAYNEEANIGKLLESLQSQKSDQIEISQIVVVSTACIDRTDELVEFYQKNDPRIGLIRQAERKGKASAINLFLRRAKGDICVLQSADTIAQENEIECLCLPFSDGRVGMTGGHVIPVDDPSKFMGFVAHLVWNLAHEVALIEPKLGELVAFRNVISKIPEDTAVDEACIEAIMKERGYHIKYVAEAYVYNKGPESVRDFIKQRRRIYAGHLHLRKVSGYRVSSINSARLLKLVLQDLKPNLKSILWTLVVVALECYARFLGIYDFYIRKRNPYIWDTVPSTKRIAYD